MPDSGATEDVAVGRPFWSGTVSFGLVSVPVNVLPANRPSRVSLRMVSPAGTPLARRYFTTGDDSGLEWDDIVRGYEVEKDRYVVVDDDELERLAPERTRDIDLRAFVKAEDIDPVYFERAYYLTPAGASTKAYRLLARAMEDTGRAGVATFVMRAKEYLVAIIADNGILRAETLRFPDEIRTPEDVGLPEPEKPKPADVNRIAKQIEKLKEAEFDPKELTDESAERLLTLVKKKVKSGEDVIAPAPDAEPGEDIVDLVAILQQSLRGERGSGVRKASGSKRASAGRKRAKTAARKRSRGRAA